MLPAHPCRCATRGTRIVVRRMIRPVLIIGMLLAAGCAALPVASQGDRALCASEPSDQVEREASRRVCR